MSGQTLPEPKPMTTSQYKLLRKAGLDPTSFDPANRKEQNDATVDMIDWVMENVYPGVNVDEVPYCDVLSLATQTYALTVGSAVATKNS